MTPIQRRIFKRTKRRLLADRQVIVRSHGRVSCITIPRTAQIIALFLFLGALGWIAHTSFQYFHSEIVLAAKDAEIAAAKVAYADLNTRLNNSRRRFADLTASLEENHRGLVSLIDQNRTLKQNLQNLHSELSRLDEDRRRAEDQKALLQQRLAEANTQLHVTTREKQTLASRLEAVGSQLELVHRDRSQARARGEALSGKLAQLRDRLAGVRESQTELLERIYENSRGEIERLDRILASTGLKPEKLLRRLGLPSFAQGGPFEPLGGEGGDQETPADFKVALSTVTGLMDHLDGLQQVMRTLPLAAPIDYYYVASSFGPRVDPINKRRAMHYGLDLGAHLRSPIYATAPGTVTYAGWNGRFGRFVEIDHGNGIVTRYGHMRRILVKRGDKVGYRTRIGQVGSSGRSTGPHLHYEIKVNGKRIDPAKFLRAGKNVFEG